MKPNLLIEQAKIDRHVTCCVNQVCRDCGAHVSSYNCNASVIAQRPEAVDKDWWAACDNADCKNAYGEGSFQMPLKWVR